MKYNNLKGIDVTDKISIYNCDCMELLKQTPDNYYSLSICDPPYGINQDKTQNDLGGKKGFVKGAGTYKKYHNTNWDSEVPNDEYFKELQRVSKNQIIWGGNYFFNIDLNGVVIWYKGDSGSFKEGEMAKTSLNTFKVFKMSRADAYINKLNPTHKIHPTQKPVDLYKFCLKNYAKPGDKILDTHLGSMSIAIACADYNFELVGCELDPDYYNAGIKRLQNHLSQLKINFDI